MSPQNFQEGQLVREINPNWTGPGTVIYRIVEIEGNLITLTPNGRIPGIRKGYRTARRAENLIAA